MTVLQRPENKVQKKRNKENNYVSKVLKEAANL